MKIYPIVCIAVLSMVSLAFSEGLGHAELAIMMNASGEEYLSQRNAIAVHRNREALFQIANDQSVDWKVQLAAFICLEKVDANELLDQFERLDWKYDPDYDPDWICSAAGYPKELIPLFHKRLTEYGLWYRYLEHYLGKIPTEPGIMRHVGNVLLENSVAKPRHFAALIANEHVKTDLAEPISWRPDALYHLKSYILDGTLPEGILTILPYKSAYFSLDADERAKAVEFIQDPVLVEHWFEFYRTNGRYDSALHKRMDALRKQSVGIASPFEQEGMFLDDRIQELQNAESTNRLPVSQVFAAGDVPESKTEATPDPIQEVPPAPSPAKSGTRMVLLFSLVCVLGLAFTRLWLSRKAMA